VDTWNIEVSRVFYGELTGNIITAVNSDPADTDHPDPATGEHILFLRPMRGQLHILAGYTPNADLETVEKEILEVIERGRYPRTTSARRLSLEENVDRADLIIRGTIRAIKDSAQGLIFQHNVTKVLHGKVDTKVITISPLADETAQKNND